MTSARNQTQPVLTGPGSEGVYEQKRSHVRYPPHLLVTPTTSIHDHSFQSQEGGGLDTWDCAPSLLPTLGDKDTWTQLFWQWTLEVRISSRLWCLPTAPASPPTFIPRGQSTRVWTPLQTSSCTIVLKLCNYIFFSETFCKSIQKIRTPWLL